MQTEKIENSERNSKQIFEKKKTFRGKRIETRRKKKKEGRE